MTRRKEEPLQKHTLMLFAGDYERLHEIYPDLGVAIIIRNLVRQHLLKVDQPTDISKIKVKGDL